jgi:small GTP-binding protein
MPANLPPQYFDVEEQYRKAKDPQEKLVYLQQLLSIIPKHKGTEKLQAELKTKIKKIKETVAKQKKSKGSGGAWYQVEKQGAGQVVLVGLPNCGKSSLLNALTNARSAIGDYPFTTQLPQVGMMEYENIKIQIVDTPPLYDDAPPWLFGLYRNGDILLLLLEAGTDLDEAFQTIRTALEDKNIFFTKHEFGDAKQVIVVVSKADGESKTEKLDSFVNKHKDNFTVLTLSSAEGNGTGTLRTEIFRLLNIIRVYTKKIGKPIVKDDPVVLKAGATVLEAAEHIHKDFKRNLKFARLWNAEGYDGQRVEKSHVLADEDVLEFHV